MARQTRSVHARIFETQRVFEAQSAFDEQLYAALRNSPWWMISVAAHVLLFVVSGMLQSDFVKPAEALQLAVKVDPAVETPPDEMKPDDPDPVEHPAADDFVARENKIMDAHDDQPAEDDNDIDNHDTYGDTDGKLSGDFTGPSTNAVIGLLGGLRVGGHGLGGRTKHGRGRGGTTQKTEDAVDHALRWLAAHQSPDGAWEAEGFGRWADGKPVVGEGPDGKGKAQYDVGVTGLALLAFLGSGITPMTEGRYGKVVRDGLKWLKNGQDAEGCLGSRATGHHVYNHSIGALALVEAYGMTGSTIWKSPAQKALDYIAISRNPYYAWRYGVKPGDNDTSVTGWMMMALKSAKLINQADTDRSKPPSFEFDADAFDGIRAWVDKMTDEGSGRVGYQQRGSGPARATDLVDRFPADRSESMTAVGVLARVFLGENPKTSLVVQKGAGLCAALPPTWNPAGGTIDMYYWYYATLALFQVGGDAWKKWDGAMKSAVAETQRLDTDYALYKGSWDPVDPWGGDGGRVYSTAVMAMCLEVYYRYDRVAGAR